MSKAIDLIAIAAALGITGYFFYKVILPNLKDIKLPTLQMPNVSFGGGQTPAPQAPTTPAGEPESIPEDKQEPEKTTDPPKGGTNTIPEPTKTFSAPPMPSGNVIWSSKAWSNGRQRSISGHHQKDPDDATIEIAAGENRLATFDGKGTCYLSGARARLYIFANNYNSQMQLTYIHNASLDNLSLRLRSHRDESGGFGGYKLVVSRNTIECAMQTAYQGSNPKLEGGDKQLPQALPANAPVTVKWHLKDNGTRIESSAWIDYGSGFKHVITAYQSSPPAVARDKAAFLKSSIAWIRTNGTAPKNVPIRNVSIVSLG